MNLLIFGLGGGYRKIVEQSIKSDLHNWSYTDSFSNLKQFNDHAFIPLEKICFEYFDIILIVITDINICQEIKKQLIIQKVLESKIIIFAEIYKRIFAQKVDKVLINSIQPTGIVLGLSHAVCGINTDYLSGYVNLACRSQDLFYNNAVLHYFRSYIKAENVRNVVLEMYDYNYFNYDVSLISHAVDFYYDKGGFNKESHNFNKNIHYNESFDAVKERYGFHPLDQATKEFVSSVFDIKKWVRKDYSGFDEIYTNTIKREESLPARKFVSGILRKRYEKTVIENKEIFYRFCREINKIFPNGRLWLILIPRFCTMEYALSPLLKEWKREFYDIIDQAENIHGFLDFKEHDICENPYMYNDVNHFNHVGALAFSSLLKEYLD